jgi:Family of unknown function (DUF6307)
MRMGASGSPRRRSGSDAAKWKGYSGGGTYLHGYEQRVKVAADALVQQMNLDAELAVAYAKCVLHAVDHIPEKVR